MKLSNISVRFFCVEKNVVPTFEILLLSGGEYSSSVVSDYSVGERRGAGSLQRWEIGKSCSTERLFPAWRALFLGMCLRDPGPLSATTSLAYIAGYPLPPPPSSAFLTQCSRRTKGPRLLTFSDLLDLFRCAFMPSGPDTPAKESIRSMWPSLVVFFSTWPCFFAQPRSRTRLCLGARTRLIPPLSSQSCCRSSTTAPTRTLAPSS